ncbi:VanZ family protein [Bacillus massilinigeriensis]|uniref:VanZ family protein n=1 Tax=Bacillus massilionigeriensis TaxID=1805475 RepID=UPI00096B2071
MIKSFNIKFIFYLAGALIVSLIIFDFSSQTYQEQTLVPKLQELLPGQPFRDTLSQISFTYSSSVVSIETKGYYYFIEFFIRKFAHLSVYFILSFFVFNLLKFLTKKQATAILITAVFVALYAISDEIHQGFTGNRTPMVRDVVIDFIGGMLAIALTILFKKRKKHR